jgi:hypothetical protein
MGKSSGKKNKPPPIPGKNISKELSNPIKTDCPVL